MAERRLLASRALTAAQYAHLTANAKRAVEASLVADLAAKGYRPTDYVLECIVDHGAGAVTLHAHELEEFERPLTFDDRGIT